MYDIESICILILLLFLIQKVLDSVLRCLDTCITIINIHSVNSVAAKERKKTHTCCFLRFMFSSSFAIMVAALFIGVQTSCKHLSFNDEPILIKTLHSCSHNLSGMCVKEDTHSPYLKVYTASVSATPPPPPHTQ